MTDPFVLYYISVSSHFSRASWNNFQNLINFVRLWGSLDQETVENYQTTKDYSLQNNWSHRIEIISIFASATATPFVCRASRACNCVLSLFFPIQMRWQPQNSKSERNQFVAQDTFFISVCFSFSTFSIRIEKRNKWWNRIAIEKIV